MVDNNGKTPLMLASTVDGVVEFLLEEGVDINKVDRDGWTALHHKAYSGHDEDVSILMVYGASLTTTTNDGRLPIDVASNGSTKALIRDEPSRRMDHGHKRAVIPDIEQANKQQRIEGDGEGEGQSSASTSASAHALTAEELKYEAEVNEDSASSDEEEIDETKIHTRHISPSDDKKEV